MVEAAMMERYDWDRGMAMLGVDSGERLEALTFRGCLTGTVEEH